MLNKLLLVPMEKGFFEKISELGTQGTSAMKVLITFAIYAVIGYQVIKHKFATAALAVGMLMAGLVWWLVMMDGISVVGALWGGSLGGK